MKVFLSESPSHLLHTYLLTYLPTYLLRKPFWAILLGHENNMNNVEKQINFPRKRIVANSMNPNTPFQLLVHITLRMNRWLVW